MTGARGNAGPLQGTRVVELAGMGPVSFAGMMLADMGAEVILIERLPGSHARFGGEPVPQDMLRRGKRSLAIDLKVPGAQDVMTKILCETDVLIEGFRPGVAERLGLGPAACFELRPSLVYGRGTGWGQEGPNAQVAGHDINFLAVTGVLNAIGRAGQPPTPPLNLVGDFGGGGMLLAFGVVCALAEAARSGRGQTVDAAMIDGVALLAASVLSIRGAGLWRPNRGSNMIDSGAHFYDVYVCADGEYLAVGAIEADHYRRLVDATGFADLDPCLGRDYLEPSTWPARKVAFAQLFRTRTCSEWLSLLETVDCCCTPVLDFDAAAEHPQISARGVLRREAGFLSPSPAPRFSRTPPTVHEGWSSVGADTRALLADHGFSVREVDDLEERRVVATSEQS